MQLMQEAPARTTLSIDGDTYRRLAKLARLNERSASAEARIALRQHLVEHAHISTLLAADAADKPAVVGAAGVGDAAGASRSLDARGGRSSARFAGRRAHEQEPGHG